MSRTASPRSPQVVSLWDPDVPMPEPGELQPVADTTFHVIKPWEPEVDGYRWLHGLALRFHRGALYASFGHNRGEENTAGELARYCVSRDNGATWSSPRTIGTGQSPREAVSHGVFATQGGDLWALLAHFQGHRENVHTVAYQYDDDTSTWRSRGKVIGDGFWPMQEPIRMDDGNWVLAGLICGPQSPPAVAISHGDDLTRWQRVTIPTEGLGQVWGESTVIVDGPAIVNISRYGQEAVALTASSHDFGRTWSALSKSNLPVATTKSYAGVLSTGQRYLVGTILPGAGERRSPLTLALSRPGEPRFSRLQLIRDALHDGPGESHTDAGLSYPYAIEHDRCLYVAYSNNGSRPNSNLNSAELAVLPLATLNRASSG